MGANEKHEATMRGFEPVTESVCERFMHDRYMTDGVNTGQSRAEFDRWLEAVRADVKAEALEDAVSDFESNVGAGEFAEQSRDGETFWRNVAEAWEAQGPYMQWLRNRAKQIREES